MNKIELQARVLLADLANPELSAEQKPAIAEAAIKSICCDVLNQLNYLKEKSIAPEVVKEMMGQSGFDLDLRTNKFK